MSRPSPLCAALRPFGCGLIAPGLPNAVIALGEKFGRLMNYGDGLYGGQFVGGMYAEAFFETDPVKITVDLLVEEMTENSVGITCTSSDYPVRRLEACEAMLANLKETLVDAVVTLGEISYGDWSYI